MAENVYLELTGANQGLIRGESAVTSLGRAEKIECLYYENSATVPAGSGTGRATGRRSFAPFVLRKRIDKSSPLLYRALTDNEAVHGIFRFYRPSPSGDGTTQQFYTVEFSNARISMVKQYVLETFDPASSNIPPLEEVWITFAHITWTYVDGGITHTDEIGPMAASAPTTRRAHG